MARITFGPFVLSLLVTALFSAVAQNGQVVHPSNSPSNPDAEKGFKFEVLSIRAVQHGPGNLGVRELAPNGFSANLQLYQAVLLAYGPPYPILRRDFLFSEVRNLPKWSAEVYAFDGRVAQADLKTWQSQGRDHDLLRAALRAALKERFKLAVHEELAQRTVFELVIAKGGPRLKVAPANEVLPVGMRLESGGVMTGMGPRGTDGLNFHAATMQDLAYQLTPHFLEGPVRDRTGFTGAMTSRRHALRHRVKNGGTAIPSLFSDCSLSAAQRQRRFW